MLTGSYMKWLIPAALVAASLVATHRSEAGMKIGYYLDVNQSYGYAIGSMAEVRNSGDSNAYLICETESTSSGANIWCVAYSSQGYLSCYDDTSSPNFQHKFNAVASLKSDSRLYFYVDSQGRCSTINVSNGSYWNPKQP